MLRIRESAAQQEKEQAATTISNLKKQLKETVEEHQEALQLLESKFSSILKINQLLEAKLFLK
jgi:hypothetical protein